MATRNDDSRSPGGIAATLWVALLAGLTTGLLFGLADAVVAGLRAPDAPRDLIGALGCAAAAVLNYGLLWCGLLLVAGILLHPLLRRSGHATRLRALLALGLGGMAFLELYWWTRPYLFYGHHSLSPERLITAGVQLVLGLLVGWALAGLLVRLPAALRGALHGLALVLWLGGALFIWSEHSQLASYGRIDETNRDLPNVLLVVVDALRADVLGCYGNEEVATPNIDSLARKGVLFEHCHAQAPYTWTSFGSILTGKYPRRHGLVAQKAGRRMAQSNVTLPYHLKTAHTHGGASLEDHAYLGGTFMTGALSQGTGLMRGFDVYAEAMFGHDLVEISSQWSVFRSELLLSIVKNKLEQRVDSSLVVSLARHWLRSHADRRFMAMVHLYSTHTPYDPPNEYKKLYCDPAYDGPFKSFYSYHREAIERGDYEPTEADIAQIWNLYKAGVTFADAMVGELVKELDDLGVLEDTLVIVTADHGESLGELHGGEGHERRLWEHNHMVDTNLRVPLVMSRKLSTDQARRIDALVESVDIFPTICDLLGIDLPPATGPRDVVDGKSLLPLLREEVEAVRKYSFSENPTFLSVQDGRWKLIVERDDLASEDPGAPLKYGAYTRLFDLEHDPQEHNNLLREEPEQAERLLAALRAWDAQMPIPVSEMRRTPRDLEQEELLKQLGYAGGIGEDEDD